MNILKNKKLISNKKLKIDYITITLNNLGFIFIKLLNNVDIEIDVLNIIINQVIKKINNISKNIGNNLNITNEKSNVHFVSFDSNI